MASLASPDLRFMNNWLRNNQNKVLVATLILAAGLRLVYLLGQNVQALNQDEAAILLNARFIWESGMDEWSQRQPIVFQSFGDYKLPGYIYGTSVVGGLFGFNMWSVRLLSWLAGLVNLVLTYFLAKRLFNSHQTGLIASGLMFLSPWSWHFSSVGFEANLGLAMWLGALLLVLDRRINWLKTLAVALLILVGGLTYNSPLLLSPLLLWGLFWIHPSWKFKQAAMAVAIILAVSVVFWLTWPATAQKQGISLFTDGTILAEYPAYRAQFMPGMTQKLLGNQYVFFGKQIVENILNSFSWKFLVSRGGANPWHTIPGIGHVIGLIPLLGALAGGWLIKLVMNPKTRRSAFLIGGLWLGALAPAAITVDAPHATRSLFFLVMLAVVAAGAWHAATMRLQANSSVWLKPLQLVFIPVAILSWLSWWIPAAEQWEKVQGNERRWHVGLDQAINQIKYTSAPIYIYDPDGVLYTRVANLTHISQAEFNQEVERSGPDTAGLFRVTRLKNYHFVSERPPSDSQGYYLHPENSQGWAIIEL